MTIAERVVGIASRRLSRRGFLGRAALIGSATVVNPLEFFFRPTSAYAAVCGPNTLCTAGYTEFCCTITGVNACPAGTVTGGWWKVDDSEYCGGAPRYYLDCNAQCGNCGCGGSGVCDGGCSGTGCGCANGDCNNRRSGCTKFRYGQCNQHIACLGPIVCRVATCTPPWLFDASCTTSSRTDANTRYHSRPCLEESFGAIDILQITNGELYIAGWAFNQDDYRDTALVRVFIDGVILADVLADEYRSDIGEVFPNFGPNHGFHLTTRVAPGKHYICIFAFDRETGKGTFLNFQEIEVPVPNGAIDLARNEVDGSLTIAGWAVDPTRPNQPPLLRFYVDNQQVAEFIADAPRPDIAEWLQRDPACGFSMNLPNVHGGTACFAVVDRFGEVSWFTCVDAVEA